MPAAAGAIGSPVGVLKRSDAPAEWIETIRRNKAAVTELITATRRDGGSVFAGPGSVVERLED
jgi:hypothetical protein